MGVIRNTNQLNRSALDEADWIYLSSDGYVVHFLCPDALRP